MPHSLDAARKRRRSYDEARLTHVAVVEASTQAAGGEVVAETSTERLRRRARELMDSNAANLFFAGLSHGGPDRLELPSRSVLIANCI